MAIASLLLHERVVLGEAVFAEIKIWQVPHPVRASSHSLRYGLALVANGTCVLRYDNEAGKGDHRHDVDGQQHAYRFRGMDSLIRDFWSDVDTWQAGQENET